MLNVLRNLTQYLVSSDMLLYGAAGLDVDVNQHIFDDVHEYIEATGRLRSSLSK